MIAFGVAGLGLAFVLFALAASLLAPDNARWSEESVRQEFAESWDGKAPRASFALEAGAGSFSIEDTTGELVAVSTRSSIGEYRMVHHTSGDIEEVSLRLDGRRTGWRLGRHENQAEIRLNSSPAWDIRVDVGAARVEFDLAPFLVDRLRLNTGAASVNMRLGGRAKNADVTVHAGASSVTVEIPDSVGCEIRVTAPLSSKHFDDFIKVEKGLYRTDNFERASSRIVLRIEAGVSGIRVKRV
jgi:hypothetical protein